MAPLSASSPEPGEEQQQQEQASRWRQPFEAVLRRILDEYEGQDETVRNGMESGMRKLFESPYCAELGKGSQPLALELAQRIIFFPTLSDMSRYVEAFSRKTPEKTARKEMLMKFKLMSVFYTLHRHDGTLVDRFMHCGGLSSLVDLLCEDQRVIQSQAMELLLEMLGPLTQMPLATSGRQAHLQHTAYTCLRSSTFWRNVTQILLEPHEIFPKSHANSIRLLAGAFSWLCQPSGAGPEPGAALPTSKVQEALQSFIDGEMYRASTPDIRGAAEDLLEELQGAPVCRPAAATDESLAAAREGLFGAAAAKAEEAAHAWQALRQLGNDAFKAGLIWPAEAIYQLAIEEGGAAIPPTEASLVHSNRALALLRAGHWADAAIAAEESLALDAGNAKAAYRYASALIELACTSSVRGRAAKALRAAELATRLEPRDAKVQSLLERARNLQEAEDDCAKGASPDLAEDECATDVDDSPALDGMD
eukprot:TRINITY_DN441_c0_g1_i1.p1 TRINITY_DN441_c0_g1~~TRINITY_DN441_c0_g1_i1.p1  ORF type:complete len:479 (+),score=96.89 TRINITY_DN441_c0_g1_i1:66-1502(+)